MYRVKQVWDRQARVWAEWGEELLPLVQHRRGAHANPPSGIWTQWVVSRDWEAAPVKAKALGHTWSAQPAGGGPQAEFSAAGTVRACV